MRSKGIQLLLGLCAAVALAPVLPWSIAAVFDRVDQRWLGSLSGLQVTIPVALGLAAIVFAVHGMLLQQALADELAVEFEDHLDRAVSIASASRAANGSVPTTVAVEVGVGAGAGAAASAAADAEPETPTRGGTMAVRERGPGFGDPGSEPTKGDKAKRVGRRYSHRVTGAVRRKFRDNFRL